MLKGRLDRYRQFHFEFQNRPFSIVWSVQFNFSKPSTLDLTLLFQIKCRIIDQLNNYPDGRLLLSKKTVQYS